MVGSLLHLEGSAAPVGQACQEQIIAGETTQCMEKFHHIQEQVKLQEIPEAQIIQQIQEQIVPERIEEQIVDILVPTSVADTVEIQDTERIHEEMEPIPVSRIVEDS